MAAQNNGVKAISDKPAVDSGTTIAGQEDPLKSKSGQNASCPIDVFITGPTPEAKVYLHYRDCDRFNIYTPAKDGLYTQFLTIQAAAPFSIVTTVAVQRGQHAGQQAILLLPFKTFPFMKLPEEIRAQIYWYYFAPARESKKKLIREYSKHIYRSKCGAALLRASRDIYEGALPKLYSQVLYFQSTGTLAAFIGRRPVRTRSLIRHVVVRYYFESSARRAFEMLATCTNIKHLSFRCWESCGSDVDKAAQTFFNHASEFFEAQAKIRGLFAGVDCLEIGRWALSRRNSSSVVGWTSAQEAQFLQALRDKMSQGQPDKGFRDVGQGLSTTLIRRQV